MNNYNRQQVDDIKLRYDLVDYISHDLGKPSNHSSYNALFKCPFHDDRKPSLSVSSTLWNCMAGCGGGDIISYVARRQGWNMRSDFPKIIEFILAGDTPTTKHTHVLNQPKPDMSGKFMEWLTYLMQYVDMGKEYFIKRGVLEHNIIPRHLTKIPEFVFDYQYSVQTSYTTLQGKKYTFNIPRYVIPNMAFGKVQSVNTRRDDNFINDLFNEYPDMFMDIQRDYQERHGIELSFLELDDLVSKRYKKWKGGYDKLPLFNGERLICKTDTGYKAINPSYVIVGETEIGAMALEDFHPDYGFMAVSIKGYRNLKPIFQNIPYVVFLADNDTPKLNKQTGKMVNRGYEIATHFCDAIDHPHCKIITTPVGKSPDDFLKQASHSQVLDFFKKHGITPVERGILNA